MGRSGTFLLLALLIGGSIPVRAQDDVEDDVELESFETDSGEVDEADLDDITPSAAETEDALEDINPDDLAEVLRRAGGDLPGEEPVDPGATMSSAAGEYRVKNLNRLLFGRTSQERASGARALGRYQDVLSVPSLITALTDRSATVRDAAAKALARVGGLEALAALRRTEANEPEPKTARSMERAIQSIESRVFSGPGGGEPITLICHSCGRKFSLARRVERGYCPYDGVAWQLPQSKK